jgi:hypothetical protein
VNQTGLVTLQIRNNIGCTVPLSDTLNVRVFPSPARPVVTIRGDSLFCSEAGTSYTWILDSTQLVTTTRNIRNQGDGNYRVYIIGANGCLSDTSLPVLYTPIASMLDNGLTLYPNPSRGHVAIKGLTFGTPWRLIDIKGQVRNEGITQNETLELESLKAGLYIFLANGIAYKIVVQ